MQTGKLRLRQVAERCRRCQGDQLQQGLNIFKLKEFEKSRSRKVILKHRYLVFVLGSRTEPLKLLGPPA